MNRRRKYTWIIIVTRLLAYVSYPIHMGLSLWFSCRLKCSWPREPNYPLCKNVYPSNEKRTWVNPVEDCHYLQQRQKLTLLMGLLIKEHSCVSNVCGVHKQVGSRFEWAFVKLKAITFPRSHCDACCFVKQKTYYLLTSILT